MKKTEIMDRIGLVTIQIVTFNNFKTIRRCLESVLVQRDVSFNIFVLDNASDDETPGIVRSLNIPIIQNDTNSGYSAGHNQLLEYSDSPYVLTLNPDAWLEPDFLVRMVEAVQPNERIGSAAGCLLRVEDITTPPTTVDSAGMFMLRNRRQKLRAEGVPINDRPMESAQIFGPDGAAAFYRRSMLRDISLKGEVFDCDFFIQKEDVDICWRARLYGWQSIYVPSAVGFHIRTFRPGQRKYVSQALRSYAIRNRYWLMIKNDDPSEILRDWFYILSYDISILIFVMLFERASWGALWSAWAQRRCMMSKRRQIQVRRTVASSEIRQWFHVC